MNQKKNRENLEKMMLVILIGALAIVLGIIESMIAIKLPIPGMKLGLANIMKTPTFNGTWWYMSYAILLVFITPYIIKWVKKAPGTSLVISLIFPRFLTSDIFISPFYWYSFTLVLGITCAEFNLFERMNTYFKSKKHVDIILI